MNKLDKLLKNVSLLLGLASAAFFVFDYLVFSRLRPRLVALESISSAEESLLNSVVIGLLLFLAFCLLTLFRLVRYLKKAKKITVSSLLLVIGGVLALLFVFSDVALLSDIGKQYRHGLAQPEWSLVYPIMGFQFVAALVFIYFHLSGFSKKGQVKHVARDSNTFLVVQYVGTICGLMGLTFSSLGFFFSRAWNLDLHVTANSIILLTPYALVVGYWLVTKLQEKDRQWYDEKQLQDVGKSAFLTLVSNVALMIGLFIVNYNHLSGVLSITWLPLHLFSVLFFFSVGNLYFSWRD
jgi:uncharacterized membrane protein YdcZ (DUF606 family)